MAIVVCLCVLQGKESWRERERERERQTDREKGTFIGHTPTGLFLFSQHYHVIAQHSVMTNWSVMDTYSMANVVSFISLSIE